jgi:glucuronate isomerase
MRRFRHATTETAGFYNTVGFNDDTRAFLSIPARHDVRGASTAVSWRKWWSNTAWPIGKRPKWRRT